MRPRKRKIGYDQGLSGFSISLSACLLSGGFLVFVFSFHCLLIVLRVASTAFVYMFMSMSVIYEFTIMILITSIYDYFIYFSSFDS